MPAASPRTPIDALEKLPETASREYGDTFAVAEVFCSKNRDCAVADRKDIGKASTDGATPEFVKR